MTNAKVNYNFEESYFGNDRLVTNNLGRTAAHLELVALGGFVGEVREFDGIANGASGRINIEAAREIRTTQINTSDTFVLGGIVYFVSGGSSAAGALRANYVSGGIPVGICTFINAGVAIGFKPFVQNSGGENDLKVSIYDVNADAKTAPIVITGLVPVGAKIVDVIVEATATSSSGTLQLKTNAGTPAVISSVIACATDNAVARTTSLANDVVGADGLQIAANGTTDRGIVTIFWR